MGTPSHGFFFGTEEEAGSQPIHPLSSIESGARKESINEVQFSEDATIREANSELSRRESALETTDRERPINEVDALPPVARPGDEEAVAEKKAPKPNMARAQVLSWLYIISYLVFFSILGTLARLGLQALTFYPGTPVSTGVLWANFGGSLILGFLMEDRQLFRDDQKERRKVQRESRRKRWSAWLRRKELVENSWRYSQTAVVGEPFASAQAARLYPHRRPDPAAAPAGVFSESPPSSRASSRSLSPAGRKRQLIAFKKTIPLYIGLSVGFCGSFTSFSSFQRDVFLAMSNAAPDPSLPIPAARNGGFSFLALLASLLLTPIMSLGGFMFGGHIALGMDPVTPNLPFDFVKKVLDPLTVVLGFGCWIGAAIMTAFPPDRNSSVGSILNDEKWRGQALFALVFAPLGCLLRFYLSLLLNSKIADFPLGTFTANMFGTLLIAGFYDLQHTPLPPGGGLTGGGVLGCQSLQGMMDGFCGCLTTVSTWVAELHGLRRRSAYNYGFFSLFLGLALVVVVMGPLRWTKGFSDPVCLH